MSTLASLVPWLPRLKIAKQWTSGEASLTFGHANANFSVFIDHKTNQFLKK